MGWVYQVHSRVLAPTRAPMHPNLWACLWWKMGPKRLTTRTMRKAKFQGINTIKRQFNDVGPTTLTIAYTWMMQSSLPLPRSRSRCCWRRRIPFCSRVVLLVGLVRSHTLLHWPTHFLHRCGETTSTLITNNAFYYMSAKLTESTHDMCGW